MSEKRLSKSEWKRLEKELCRKRQSVWSQLAEGTQDEAKAYAEMYKGFLDKAKTERVAVSTIVEWARGHGFAPIENASSGERQLLWTFREKVAALAVLGRQPLGCGVRVVASHIDAPRLDLKQNPLYEELEMAFLKTHYYGGIKKFHWVARPLALYGTVLRSDGIAVALRVGEALDEPVLTINDLLPHLAGKVQADKKMREAIPAEKLNVLVGGLPLPGPQEAKEAVKLRILRLLSQKFGLIEEDFVSGELEVVPAGSARDVGLDRAFVGGYGQDDRSCAFASLKAILDLHTPPVTAVAFFMDKEEIGSYGNTGAKSRFFDVVFYDLLRQTGSPPEADTLVRLFLASRAISADSTAGVDPDYLEVHEKRNDALVGHGICLTKYTGVRGKYSANDAHAEYINWIRRTWNQAGVLWQAGELGKVDEGGGGTVAKYLAQHGLDIVDAGPPVLSMHSPFEVAHKGDLFMTYRAFRAFYESEVDLSADSGGKRGTKAR